MLPLWIIDLTENSDRQVRLKELIGHLHGVLFQEDIQNWISEGASNKCQWLYSQFDNPFASIDQDDPERMSLVIYDFQEKIVKAGQDFVQMLRHSNIDGSVTMNICVLGDATENLSQQVFPSIAVLLQKEKGRIVPNHIHQGMAIIGAYFIPANINSLNVNQRQKVYLSLKEIEVQHNIPSIRGYDRMFFYQDVQNRTECYFPILTSKEQAEYLFQCLVHLYYVCDKVHPLISGSSSDDHFYFSMGCASTFFDTDVQDKIEKMTVINDVIDILSKEGDLEQTDNIDQLIDFNKIDAEEIIMKFQNIDFDLSKATLNDPAPHPIANFADYKLKRLYYGTYLKYYPANLRLKILDVISKESENVLEEISTSRKRAQNIFAETTLPAAIERQLTTSNVHFGCLSRISRNLKCFKTEIGKMKGRVKNQIEQNIWQHLLQYNVPKNLKDDFESYHESYTADLESKKGSHHCEEMKQSALNDLVNTLKQEPTFLGRLSRSFLTGIIFVLTFMPLITLISKDLIDLGNVKKDAVYWSAFLFLIPLICQLISMALFYRKKNKKERKIKAYYLHDAYSRIANRIETEVNCLYDNMSDLCDSYLKRCKLITKDIRPYPIKDIYAQTELPVTLFNQPVIQGSFAENTMVQDLEEEGREIYVQRVPCKISSLDLEDCHLLLHRYKDEVMSLFHDIKLREQHERKFDEELGYNVFLSQKEKEEEDAEKWDICQNNFKHLLQVRIEKDILPRKNPTIGEKIWFYAEKMDNQNVLKPLIYAAATNGELTTNSDIETGDVKGNIHKLESLLTDGMPSHNTQYQFDSHNELLKKYLFVTRWRSFDNLSLNRILPSEDFDMEIRRQKVNEDELGLYQNATSSLILWAICQNDNSSEWLKLFDATRFSESLKIRDQYTSKLNNKD